MVKKIMCCYTSKSFTDNFLYGFECRTAFETCHVHHVVEERTTWRRDQSENFDFLFFFSIFVSFCLKWRFFGIANWSFSSSTFRTFEFKLKIYIYEMLVMWKDFFFVFEFFVCCCCCKSIKIWINFIFEKSKPTKRKAIGIKTKQNWKKFQTI